MADPDKPERKKSDKPRRATRTPATIATDAVLKMPLGQLVQFADDLARKDRTTAAFLHEKLGAALNAGPLGT